MWALCRSNIKCSFQKCWTWETGSYHLFRLFFLPLHPKASAQWKKPGKQAVSGCVGFKSARDGEEKMWHVEGNRRGKEIEKKKCTLWKKERTIDLWVAAIRKRETFKEGSWSLVLYSPPTVIPHPDYRSFDTKPYSEPPPRSYLSDGPHLPLSSGPHAPVEWCRLIQISLSEHRCRSTMMRSYLRGNTQTSQDPREHMLGSLREQLLSWPSHYHSKHLQEGVKIERVCAWLKIFFKPLG